MKVKDLFIDQILIMRITQAIKLFSIDKVNDWKIVDNNLLIMSNDTLYLYNDDIGLRKVVSNNEFKYNYKNIYNLYFD